MEDNERSLYFQLQQAKTQLKAVFEPYAHPLLGKIIINEVGPNNKKAGDWIEIFNHSKEKVTMSKWVLTDRKNEFLFPEVRLAPNDYLIICQDSIKFREVFPEAYNVIGGLDFGINKRRETLRLFSRLGAAVDSFSYDIPPIDSTFSLSLLLPSLDNSEPENWEVRYGNGSPNFPNPYYVESKIRSVQGAWMQVGLALGSLLLFVMLLILKQKRKQ